eukprot:TRINITY_DN9318_c5_g1_i1.p1 TRINITY_DN9318_c5_g1~~TRINITY_DN9318_c5_g1_i1.p1  ORF type:complete len:656 (+),score=167.81 TRINITY_DN9318_c5_g1_i1:118-1968(+)
MRAVHALLLYVAPCVAAGGGRGLFDVDPELMNHPFLVFFMFFLVIIVSVGHEVFFHWADTVVRTHSGRKLKSHLEMEVMNLGLIGLWLTFVQSIGITGSFWSAHLFHYTHFVLFTMMVILMGFTGILLLTMGIVWQTWVRYEAFTRMVMGDENMPQQQKDITLALYYARNANAKRMNSCHQFYMRSIPKEYAGVDFTRYLRKSQRRWLLHLLHLNKWSWLSLAALIGIIAVLLWLHGGVPQGSGSGSGSGSGAEIEVPGMDWVFFIIFVGYGTLIVLLGIMAKVSGSFRRFCEDIETDDVGITSDCYSWELPQPNQHQLFWRGDPKFTIQLLQMVILWQVFYLAVVICNILPRLGDLPLGMPLAIGALVPSVVIFGFLMPLMMPPFTCLASLGDFLNTDMLRQMKTSASAAGTDQGGDGLFAGSPRGGPVVPFPLHSYSGPPRGAFEFIIGRVKGLPRMDMTGPGADPYVKVYRDGLMIHQTRVEHGLSVIWAETVKIEPPPGGFRSCVVLRCDVFDWDRRGSHDFIGWCEISIDDDAVETAREINQSLRPEVEGGWDDDGGLGTLYAAARRPPPPQEPKARSRREGSASPLVTGSFSSTAMRSPRGGLRSVQQRV